MSSQTFRPQDSASADESEIRELYRQMLDGWNNRSADAFAVPFAEDGESISAAIVPTIQHLSIELANLALIGRCRVLRLEFV